MTHIDFDDASATPTTDRLTSTQWAKNLGIYWALTGLSKEDRRALDRDLAFHARYAKAVSEAEARILAMHSRLMKVNEVAKVGGLTVPDEGTL